MTSPMGNVTAVLDTGNPFCLLSAFAQLQLDAARAATDFEQMFVGSKEVLQKRWAASAVLTDDGSMMITPSADMVQIEGSAVRVRLAEGGSFVGRVQ